VKGPAITEGFLTRFPAAGLEVVEAAVSGAPLQQFVVVALLDDPAAFEEDDQVRVGDGVQVVRDQERSPTGHQAVEGFLNLCLALHVEGLSSRRNSSAG
jgi:hypothetical protein